MIVWTPHPYFSLNEENMRLETCVYNFPVSYYYMNNIASTYSTYVQKNLIIVCLFMKTATFDPFEMPYHIPPSFLLKEHVCRSFFLELRLYFWQQHTSVFPNK